MNRPLLLRILLAGLAVYTLVEFYPFSLSLYFIPHYVMALLCLVFLALYPGTRIVGAWNLKPALFLVFWLAFNLASYVWARDNVEVLRYSLWILRYLVLFLIYSKVFTHEKYLRNFEWFLFGIVILYVATAIWEMVSFQHLGVSKHFGEFSYVPTGPFYGENHLAAYLLLFSPFLLFMPKFAKPRGWAYLSAFIVLAVVVIMTVQGARIAMLAIGAFLLWFFLAQITWRRKFVLAAILALLFTGVYLRFKTEIRFISQILSYQTQTLGSERSSIYMSSIQIRQQLLKEAFDLAARTGFLGAGGGNFEPQMRSEAVYRTGGIVNPHNFLMELFGNWGIVVLGAFVYLYLHWALGLWRLYRRTKGKERTRYLMYLVSLLLFLPASILPSTIRWQYFVWIYFAAVNAALHTKPSLQEVDA